MKVCSKCGGTRKNYASLCNSCYRKIHYQKNKDKIVKKKREYYLEKRDYFLQERKKYYHLKKKEIFVRIYKLRNKNPEGYRLYLKEWAKNNIDKVRKCHREKQRRYYKNSDYRLRMAISHQIYLALKENKAGKHWEELVGYSLEDLKNHLASQFTKEMSFDNYCTFWQIDHRIPQSWFEFETHTDEEFRKCWALENLQPLECSKNLSKSNSYADS